MRPQLKKICLILSLFLLCSITTGGSDRAWAQRAAPVATFTRVSVATGGGEANNESALHDIADSGRYVVFVSAADNLVPADTNEADDIFVHDRATGQTERVSVASSGAQADSYATAPTISADGRFVAFASAAKNLVAGESTVGGAIFLRDRVNRTTTLVSVNSEGEPANGNSFAPAISPDGTYIAFLSGAKNLDPRIVNEFTDQLFLHNRLTGETRLLSVNAADEPGNNRSGNPLGGGVAVSNGGALVAFVSVASNLVTDDTNDKRDIFLYRSATSKLERLSVGVGGQQSNGNAWSVRMSSNGQRILFDAEASNLIANDTNEQTDLFLLDLASHTLTLASPDLNGAPGEGGDGDISADGRYVVYSSNTGRHVANDCNAFMNCIYRYDTQLEQTILLSVNGVGAPAGNHSQGARIAADGSAIAFQSLWDGYVSDDTNEYPDLFVYSSGAEPTPVAAQFVVDVRQAPDGHLILPWASREDLSLPVRLAQSHPTTVTVAVQVTDPAGQSTVHDLLFPPQQMEQPFTIANPQPAEPAIYTVKLLLDEVMTAAAVPSQVGFGIGFLGLSDEEICYMGVWCSLMGTATWHDEPCPGDLFAAFANRDSQVEQRATAPMLETLYATRDRVMRKTPTGRYYTNLYYSHTTELTKIMLNHPTVLWETWDGITNWLPALAALVDDEGATVTVTAAMVDDLETVLALFAEHGSAPLRTAIANEKALLALPTLVGLSMEEAWTEVNQRADYELYLPMVATTGQVPTTGK